MSEPFVIHIDRLTWPEYKEKLIEKYCNLKDKPEKILLLRRHKDSAVMNNYAVSNTEFIEFINNLI